jgi:hypothetical protein
LVLEIIKSSLICIKLINDLGLRYLKSTIEVSMSKNYWDLAGMVTE